MRQREKHFSRREKVQGQFLTPYEVASFIVNFVCINSEKVLGIDPSCGDGVFLKALAEAKFRDIIGIDVDQEMLNKLPSELKDQTKALCGEGLQPLALYEGAANAVVGNPPFSAKYGRVNDPAILSNFELGRGRNSQAIEILFLERFLQLASSKGIIGIILPHGIFSSLPLKYVRTFIMNKASVLGIISLPRRIFSNGTTSKTCILFAQKERTTRKTFMGIAKYLEDLPVLLEAYTQRQELESPPAFSVELSSDTFIPEFYWSRKTAKCSFKDGLPIARLGDLLYEMRCGGAEYAEKRRFVERGIPFVSAKTVTPLGLDLSRNERYIEPDSDMDKKWAYVKPGDIVFVRVGVGCSGRAAVVLADLEKGIADDWIYIIRAKGISPFYLSLFLQSKLGQHQIEPLKRGVGTVTIPQKLLKEILVPLPSNSFQQTVEAGYKEVVRLRKAGCLTEAEEKFKLLLSSIETAVGIDEG
ncbi:MAG: N-6 DNA methylase [Dehalococcoidales bacterium]|nr:N-6 DNA methylase [Dehalococcoidales bacterium]